MLVYKFIPIDKGLGFITLISIMLSIASEMVLMSIIYSMISGASSGEPKPVNLILEFYSGLSFRYIGGIALGAALLKICASYYAIKKKSAFIFHSQTSLSSTLYKKFIWKNYRDTEKRTSAELIRTIGNETQNVIKMVLIPIVSIISESLPAISILLFALYLRPIESAVSFFSIGLMGYLINRFFKYKISEWGNLRRKVEEQITGILIDSDRLFKEITIYGRQFLFAKKFDYYQGQLAEVGIRQNFAAEIPKVILEGIVYAGMVLYLMYGLFFLPNPLEVVGAIAVLGLTALRVVPSVHRIVSAFNTIRFGLPSLLKISLELEVPEQVLNPKIEKKICTSLEIQKLSFCRPGFPDPVFSEISFVAHKGEIIGIKGPSGSGKSTFLNVIMGLLPASSGKIYMDGKDITTQGLYNVTSIGIVPQQVYIFNGSIAENLSLYDMSGATWQVRAKNSLKTAKILDFVNTFDLRLDKQLSENSKDISGGQAQRFSIARSLYSNPEILLFDEFTSALDQSTQDEIIDELREIADKKIVIVVSHSSKVLSICDKVIDLEKSCVS